MNVGLIMQRIERVHDTTDQRSLTRQQYQWKLAEEIMALYEHCERRRKHWWQFWR